MPNALETELLLPAASRPSADLFSAAPLCVCLGDGAHRGRLLVRQGVFVLTDNSFRWTSHISQPPGEPFMPTPSNQASSDAPEAVLTSCSCAAQQRQPLVADRRKQLWRRQLRRSSCWRRTWHSRAEFCEGRCTTLACRA